jgi:hypothetical protein
MQGAMELSRIEASYQRISKIWSSDSELDRRIERALLADLLEALDEMNRSAVVIDLTERVTSLFNAIGESLNL